MTTLATGLNTAVRMCFCSAQGRVYATNGFDDVLAWDGVWSAAREAGITGPVAAMGAATAAAGNTTNGAHRLRYRYRDANSGYVSNPSPELVVSVSGGNGQLTFTVGAGQDIIASLDSKVTHIDVEMTAVNGQVFYTAVSVLNTAATAVVNVADTALIQSDNADALYGSSETLDVFSHDRPPLGTIMVAYKGYVFIGGDEARTITATFTNTSTTVTGTGFSDRWAGYLVRVAGEAVAYRIASATTTTLTLEVAWTGSTGSKTASVYSPTPNRVYYSRPGAPEEFYPEVFFRTLLQNRSDQLVGMFPRRDALYTFGKYSSERLIFSDDPSPTTSFIDPIQGDRGVFNQRCLVEANGDLFAWDRNGIYVVGDKPQAISASIDPYLAENADYSLSAKFHAGYDPLDRCLLFFFVASGDTQPKYAAVFELDTARWSVHKFLNEVTACAVVPTSDGQVRLLLGDSAGYSWFYGLESAFDGVPPTTSAVVTATGTPTTTVISVTQTLDTSPSLAGVVLYNPSNGQQSTIASNTASQITLATALTNAPVAGDTLYLGMIPWEYRTKWWAGASGMEAKKCPVLLVIKLYPGTATGKLRVYIYNDFSTTPTVVTKRSDDILPDGISITTGNSYIDVDLDGGSGDGYVSVPMARTWKRVVQARLVSDRPDGDLRVMDVSFVLQLPPQKPQEKPAVRE